MPGITKLVSVTHVNMGQYLETFKLWEDLGNWHSSLKKKAHTLVHECYEWDAQNHCPINADIVRGLLERGHFLKSGVDEDVSGKLTNNNTLIVF